MLDSVLKNKINRLWTTFWSSGISNPLSAIEQISYLIFIKRLDDLDTNNMDEAQARGQSYRSIFEDHEDCRWSRWAHLNADEMSKHVTLKVFPFVRNLHNGDDVLCANYLSDIVFTIQKPSLLKEAVSSIDVMDTRDKPDIQGDIYEHLLGELKTAGKNGQFRTPRHIIRMMVELIDPYIGQKISDPACGTDGFLIAAYQHILRKYTSPDKLIVDEDGALHNLVGDKMAEENWRILWNETFYGFDFEITMVRIAFMNMVLHGVRKPNIQQIDTLSQRFDQTPRFDIIFSNPPFAGFVDKSDINTSFRIDTTKTELLFLELFYNLLKVGGKAAVIVPSGVLFGSSNAHLNARKLLLEKCDLQAVISMPSGVFQPYTGVNTAVLVFVKGGETGKVWFYDMKADGYTLDQRRVFIDGKGDIPDIIDKFRNRTESERSILVPVKTLRDNNCDLSISRYRRPEPDKTVSEEPATLIENALRIEDDIAKSLQELREVL